MFFYFFSIKYIDLEKDKEREKENWILDLLYIKQILETKLIWNSKVNQIKLCLYIKHIVL